MLSVSLFLNKISRDQSDRIILFTTVVTHSSVYSTTNNSIRLSMSDFTVTVTVTVKLVRVTAFTVTITVTTGTLKGIHSHHHPLLNRHSLFLFMTPSTHGNRFINRHTLEPSILFVAIRCFTSFTEKLHHRCSLFFRHYRTARVINSHKFNQNKIVSSRI